jgi:hypothetical protein
LIQVAENYTPPEIDYLAKDYASFRQLLLDHLSLWLPGWTEGHAADLGHALVEVLAYAADYLSYYQDAVATEAYLGTARLRRSVRRHVRLLDYDWHEGCNARAWVQVQAQGQVVLPKGTQLLTRLEKGGANAVIGRDSPAYAEALAQASVIFETMHDVRLYQAHNEIGFYTGDAQHQLEEIYTYTAAQRRVWLKKGATRAVLREWLRPPSNDELQPDPSKRRLQLKAGDVLIFEEMRNPETGRGKGADPMHRHPVRLTGVTPTTHNQTQTVGIEWDVEDALPFDLCLTASYEGTQVVDISLALGNIVLADHGQTVRDEALPPVPTAGRYYPHLRHAGLTYWVPFHRGRAAIWSAQEMLLQDARQALPCLELRELGKARLELAPKNGQSLLPLEKHRGATFPVKHWGVRSELLGSGIFERDYAVEMEEDGRAYLSFGFPGVGWQPEVVGAPFVATYRIGNGAMGNVGREAIAHIVTDDKRITGVRNPLPARGGTDPASTEEARMHAPQAFRALARCVTEADYARAAERHPEVARAVAQVHWTGSWRTVFIQVQRRGDRPLDADFRRELGDFMEPFRLAGFDLEIQGARLVALEIALDVYLWPGHQASIVHAALQQVFGHQVLPDGTLGFFHADHWTFGQAVYQSQVIARAMAVPGVARVEVSRFRRRGADCDVDPIPVGRLEIIQVHNDPDDPSKGTITFQLSSRL